MLTPTLVKSDVGVISDNSQFADSGSPAVNDHRFSYLKSGGRCTIIDCTFVYIIGNTHILHLVLNNVNHEEGLICSTHKLSSTT